MKLSIFPYLWKAKRRYIFSTPAKRHIFSMQIFFSVVYKKHINTLSYSIHGCYFLFNTFFSQVSNENISFYTLIPFINFLSLVWSVGQAMLDARDGHRHLNEFSLFAGNGNNKALMTKIYLFDPQLHACANIAHIFATFRNMFVYMNNKLRL